MRSPSVSYLYNDAFINPRTYIGVHLFALIQFIQQLSVTPAAALDTRGNDNCPEKECQELFTTMADYCWMLKKDES